MNQVIVNPKALPSGLKDLRACVRCSLIKTRGQFLDRGCENCRGVEMEGDALMVSRATTNNFSGMISLMETDSSQSWVCRYQGFGTYMCVCAGGGWEGVGCLNGSE